MPAPIGGHAKLSPGSRLLLPALAASLVLLFALAIYIFRQSFRPAPALPPLTLAVLPFRNLKPGQDTDFLGVSLADEVTGKLGYVKALTVRPSSAINRYREGTSDLHKIATALKTGMLLTGTYLKDGDDLRITARLIGFNPDAVLWQNTLEVKYDKLLTVQDRVARMIIDGLSLRLGSDEQVRLASQAPVDKLAYEYYLRGVDLYSTSNFTAAIAMLEKSVALDPGYAPTWAYLGRAYTTNGSLQFGGREHYRRAEAAYDKAIALNPVFPAPRVYMANLFTDTGRVEEAVPLLRVALQNSPNDAEAHWELGYAYRYGGMLEESATECELARRLDPEVKINSSALNTYLYLGEYDKFLNSLPSNDSPLLLFYHGFGSYYKHDYSDAVADFDRAYELAPELLPAQVGKALSDALQHEEAHGLARLRETETRMNLRGVTDPEAMYKVAQAYAVLGAPDAALHMLQRSTVGGFFCYPYIARDPLLSSLRNSPEFVRLLAQARQRQQQFQMRFSRPGS
jgi:TolB-like protein